MNSYHVEPTAPPLTDDFIATSPESLSQPATSDDAHTPLIDHSHCFYSDPHLPNSIYRDTSNTESFADISRNSLPPSNFRFVPYGASTRLIEHCRSATALAGNPLWIALPPYPSYQNDADFSSIRRFLHPSHVYEHGTSSQQMGPCGVIFYSDSVYGAQSVSAPSTSPHCSTWSPFGASPLSHHSPRDSRAAGSERPNSAPTKLLPASSPHGVTRNPTSHFVTSRRPDMFLGSVSPYLVLDADLSPNMSWKISCDCATGVCRGKQNDILVWDLHSATYRSLSPSHVDKVSTCALSSTGDVCATSLRGGMVHVYDTNSLQLLYRLQRRGYPCSQGCALSGDGNTLAATLRVGDGSGGLVVISQWRDHKAVASWSRPVDIGLCDISGNGSVVAYVCGYTDMEKVVEVADTRGKILLRWNLRQRRAPAFAFSFDGRVFAIADKRELRVHNFYGCPSESISLDGYICPGLIICCSLSTDGSRACANIGSTEIGVWNAESGFLVARLSNCTGLTSGVKMAGNGSKVIACGDNKLRFWSLDTTIMPGQVGAPSALDVALHDALMLASAEDNSYISRFPKLLFGAIKRTNVCNTTDLIAGHNLVLLAMRLGLLTADRLYAFGDGKSSLYEELYLPACEKVPHAVDYNAFRAVVRHAEGLGIIKSHESLLAAAKIMDAGRKQFENIAGCITDMSRRIAALDARIFDLETNANSFGQDLRELCLQNNHIGNCMLRLRGDLEALHKAIDKQNRRNMYCSLTRCMLSFIPVLGSALGNGVSAAADIFCNLSTTDLIQLDVNIMQELISCAANVDVSNMQVARFAFSEKCMSKNLSDDQEKLVQSVVEDSPFRSCENLRLALEEEIRKSPRIIHVIDLGSGDWASLSHSGATQSLEDGRSRDSGLLSENHARTSFRQHLRPGMKMNHGEAANEIMSLLARAGCEIYTTREYVENALCEFGLDEVNEDVFMTAFRNIMVQINANQDRRVVWSRMFQNAVNSTGRMSTSQAAKLIRQVLYDDFCSDETQDCIPQERSILERLEQYDSFDGKVGVDCFIGVVYGLHIDINNWLYE